MNSVRELAFFEHIVGTFELSLTASFRWPQDVVHDIDDAATHWTRLNDEDVVDHWTLNGRKMQVELERTRWQ